MSRKILFINFSACSYTTESEFFAQQAAVLLYKTELAHTNEIHYLLNNNLRLQRKLNKIHFHSRNYHNLIFILYAVTFTRREKIDAVIIHGTNFLMQSVILKKLTSALVILQHHGESTFLRKKSALFGLVNSCLDGYFFNGRGVADGFVSKGFSANKIFEVTEGTTNFEMLPTNVHKKDYGTIVSIGRLNRDKNTIVLLKAIKLLKKIRTDFMVQLFYSTSDQEHELKQFCNENDIQDKVVFRGKVSQHEIEKELNTANIFISASLREAGGYSLIESLACGAFPVVSAIPSFEYLLRDLEDKRLFAPDDEKTLAAVLDQVLNMQTDKEARRRIRKHFEDRASATAISRQIEKALDILFRK
jgi:glycosyltransferase involved in cell wall biosynthesis